MKKLTTCLMIGAVLMLGMTAIIKTTLLQTVNAEEPVASLHDIKHEALAPIATSGNHVYIAWWSNKSGNDEILFRASSDNGQTYGPKINLSNSTERSVDAEIAAQGNNVYVTWWEEVRNATKEIREPVVRASTDNGETFGPAIMLSNVTSGGAPK
jgi:hypothetical protein